MNVPSYSAMHRRVRALRGPAAGQPCAECGDPARFWTYTGTDPDERRDRHTGQRYSLDPGRYRARCASCHRTMAAGHRPVTGEALDRAAALYETGTSLAAIADELHVTRPVVRAALAGRGVTIRPPRSDAPLLDRDRAAELYAEGTSIREIAERLAVTRAAVRAALTARGAELRTRSGDLDVGRAAPLYEAGASLRGIAAVLGASPAAVRAALVASGVTIRPPGPTRRHIGRSSTISPAAPLGTTPTPPMTFTPLPTTSRQPSRPPDHRHASP